MGLRAAICGIGSFYSDAFARTAIRHPEIGLVAYAHLDQPDEELHNQKRKGKEDWGRQYSLKAYSQVSDMVRSENLNLVFVRVFYRCQNDVIGEGVRWC